MQFHRNLRPPPSKSLFFPEYGGRNLRITISKQQPKDYDPRLQYLQQVTRKTGADSYTAMKRMACNKSRLKAANKPNDSRIRRRS
jgi:hypothetical protein